MEKLRVKNRAVNIEVNDDGEFITLNFKDGNFIKRYYALLDAISKKKKEVFKKENDLNNKPDKKDEFGISNKEKELIFLHVETCEYLKKEIDKLFGKDTCRKVFGDIIPDFDTYEEFFDAIEPYFEKYAKESTTVMNKYSAKRVGDNVQYLA